MALECWARLSSEQAPRVVRAEGSRVLFSRPYVSGPVEWDDQDWVDPCIGTIEELKPAKGGVIALSRSGEATIYEAAPSLYGDIFFQRTRRRAVGIRQHLARALRSLADRLES